MSDTIKEIPDICSNCGGKIEEGDLYTCPKCGESLCIYCNCECDKVDIETIIDKEFEIEEDNEITKIDWEEGR